MGTIERLKSFIVGSVDPDCTDKSNQVCGVVVNRISWIGLSSVSSS